MLETVLDMNFKPFSFLRGCAHRVPSSSVLSRFLSSLLISAAVGLFFVPSSHGFTLSMSHTPSTPNTTYNLSWTAVQVSTPDTLVTYYIYQEFGRDGVSDLGPNSYVFATQDTSAPLFEPPGSRCMIVRSSTNVLGLTQWSNEVCHGFVHNLTSEGIARADGDGTQRGVDQKWKFTYSLDEDALFTAKIYPPGTLFTNDTNYFAIAASSPLIKTLVENTARSGEMGSHSITNCEEWDSRTSSGTVVPNGIYYLLLQATLDSGYFPGGVPPLEYPNYPPAVRESWLRDGITFSIPVDILRIMNLAATGITINKPTSSITYELTGDALVRVLIAQPGSAFVIDVNGDIQAASRTTGAIDDTLIVSTFSFQRKAGKITESWDGTSSTGTVMRSGVYPVSISAKDEYGNHAIMASGDDYALFTMITLERSAGSDQGANTVQDTVPPTLTSISPSNGGSLSTTVSSITIVLADNTALNLSGVAVSIRGPNNTTVTGNVSNNGQNTITVAFPTPLSANGNYAVTIVALDTAGNSATFISNFSINIRLEAGAFEGSYKLYPNPAKNTPILIEYGLSVAATVDVEIYDVLGNRVWTANYSDGAGIQMHPWDLRNSSGKKVGSGVYLVRVKANGGGSKVDVVKKLVVIQ